VRGGSGRGGRIRHRDLSPAVARCRLAHVVPALAFARHLPRSWCARLVRSRSAASVEPVGSRILSPTRQWRQGRMRILPGPDIWYKIMNANAGRSVIGPSGISLSIKLSSTDLPALIVRRPFPHRFVPPIPAPTSAPARPPPPIGPASCHPPTKNRLLPLASSLLLALDGAASLNRSRLGLGGDRVVARAARVSVGVAVALGQGRVGRGHLLLLRLRLDRQAAAKRRGRAGSAQAKSLKHRAPWLT